MRAGLFMLESGHQLLEGEMPVNDRPQADGLKRRHQIGLILSATNQHALESLLAKQ